MFSKSYSISNFFNFSKFYFEIRKIPFCKYLNFKYNYNVFTKILNPIPISKFCIS